MSLPRKLESWVEAGFISREQSARILTHEKSGSGSRFKLGIIFAGLFSILLGISLVVAANWSFIPAGVKLGTHFLINAVLATLVYRWRQDPARAMHRDVALFILWGLTLTLIALIGQIFQLSGDMTTALRVWFWLTTPMILLLAQSAFIARLWALAFVVYVPIDIFSTLWDHTQNWNIRKAVLLATGIILPLATWIAGSWRQLNAARPAMGEALRGTGLALALFAASIVGYGFYDHMRTDYSLLIPAVFAAFTIVTRIALQSLPHWSHEERGTIDLIAICGLFFTLPFLVPVTNDAFAVLHFVALWLLAGMVWQAQGHDRLVGWAVRLVTLRLFIGFVEIFGSLAMSGLGFIVMGAVLIGLVLGARRISKYLKDGVA